MFDRRFLASSLGKATLASIAAMGLFVMASTQIAVTPPLTQVALGQSAEVA